MIRRFQLLLVLLVPLTGCLSHTRDAADAARAADAADTADAGAASPDSSAPDAQAAEPSCRDQDARGEGGCEVELGYVWRDGACWSISGCSCTGGDCGALADTQAACLEAHRSCTRACGGFAGLASCLAGEYCDYPDGSFCGGDDSPGLCAPRPTECPDPSGSEVCGCDGESYLSDCWARLAGTDVHEPGACVTTRAYDTARADSACGPTDGPAWTITLTSDRSSCDVEPVDGSILLFVWEALETATPGTVYALGGDVAGDGQAMICARPGEPCAPATGTVSFSVFTVGELARFDFDVRTRDGRRFAQSGVEIARWWCDVAFPGCG